MKIIIGIVAAVTLWPAVLSAAEGERERKWKIDIVGCVQEVRRLNPYSRFDAFAVPGMEVEYFGTAQDGFQFRKCMAERGWKLRD